MSVQEAMPAEAVKKGEVLARLENKEQRAQLQELEARADFAEREAERMDRRVHLMDGAIAFDD